jgi:hypothetical protein
MYKSIARIHNSNTTKGFRNNDLTYQKTAHFIHAHKHMHTTHTHTHIHTHTHTHTYTHTHKASHARIILLFIKCQSGFTFYKNFTSALRLQEVLTVKATQGGLTIMVILQHPVHFRQHIYVRDESQGF